MYEFEMMVKEVEHTRDGLISACGSEEYKTGMKNAFDCCIAIMKANEKKFKRLEKRLDREKSKN